MRSPLAFLLVLSSLGSSLALPGRARADRVRDVLAPLDRLYGQLDALYRRRSRIAA